MSKLVTPLRFFFKYIVPACFAVVMIIKILSAPDLGIIKISFGFYFDIVYKILLSSMVGYFTNFLAIKMLFKPKEKTRHGIQGLVPGNQDQIAEKLGSGISDNFFNASDLIDYLNQNDIIADSISSLKRYVEVNLEDPEHQKAITKWILNTFRSNSPRIFNLLVQLSEMNLSKYLQKKIDLNSLAKEIIELIEKNISDGTFNLKAISKELTIFIHNNIPQISQFLFEQMKKIIEQQNPLKRNILKFATWTFDVDQFTIEQQLYEMVSSQKFRTQVYENLEQVVDRLAIYLNSDTGTQDLNRYYKKLIILLDEKIRTKGIPNLLIEVEKFLQKEASWLKIELYLKKGLSFIQESLEKIVAGEKFDRFLTESMPAVLEKIKISSIVTQKVKAFDTNELEKMILDASGEHLAVIEVLGGVLGGLAGIALFNPLLFLSLLCPMIVIGFLEYLMTIRQRKKEKV